MKKYQSYSHYLRASRAVDSKETFAAYCVAAAEFERRKAMEFGGEELPAVNRALIANTAKLPYSYGTRFCFPRPAEI